MALQYTVGHTNQCCFKMYPKIQTPTSQIKSTNFELLSLVMKISSKVFFKYTVRYGNLSHIPFRLKSCEHQRKPYYLN